MADRIVETTTRNGDTVRKTTDYETENTATSRNDGSSLAARIIWFIAGVIITLLAFRFVLILLGANQGSGFVDFIYSVSYPFAVPFFGILGYDLEYGRARLEVASLIAIAVYAVVATGLARLVTLNKR